MELNCKNDKNATIVLKSEFKTEVVQVDNISDNNHNKGNHNLDIGMTNHVTKQVMTQTQTVET